MTRIRAVLFDLDGTLTRPVLDFNVIREEIGGIDGPILESIAEMSHSQRARAEAILHAHEDRAAECAQLNPGAEEILGQLAARGVKLGIITRNRRECTEIVLKMLPRPFDIVLTREDGPWKPDPSPILMACKKLRVDPEEALMVGDYEHDLVAAQRAGVAPVLLTTHHDWRRFAHQARFTIDSLAELAELLDKAGGCSPGSLTAL